MWQIFSPSTHNNSQLVNKHSRVTLHRKVDQQLSAPIGVGTPRRLTLEAHSALEHFRLEISGVLFPVGRLPNAESDCQTLSLQCVVSRQSTAYTATPTIATATAVSTVASMVGTATNDLDF